MTTAEHIKQPNNVIYVVDTDRSNKCYIEEMTEAEYLKRIAWLTRRKHADYELRPVFQTLKQQDTWDQRFEEPLKWNELDERDTLASLSDEGLEEAGIRSVEFELGAHRFNSWSDLFDAVYDEAHNESPDNVPSYFGSEKGAQAAIDEWTAEEDE